MTVAELIKELQEKDPLSEVFFYEKEYGDFFKIAKTED